MATPLQEDLMHPRRALDIARSYGVPKYFLRGNSQILTDGRMRLFADNVWKKERMSPPQDGSKSTENSDVICRLIDSVDKAIATSERPQQDFSAAVGLGESDGTVGGLRLDHSTGEAGAGKERERSLLRDRFVSFPDVLSRVSVVDVTDGDIAEPKGVDGKTKSSDDQNQSTGHPKPEYKERDVCHSRDPSLERGVGGDSDNKDKVSDAIRPHTVDTAVPGYLPRVAHFREQPGAFSNKALGIPEDQVIGGGAQGGGINRGMKSLSSQAAGIRLRQYRGVADSLSSSLTMDKPTPTNNINNRVGVLFGGKYRNVLPRFYPAVSAHHVRQREAAMRLGATAGMGGVRFSNTSAGGAGQKRVATQQEAAASTPQQHPPRRLVRFADTPHTVRFSRETPSTTPTVFKPALSSGIRGSKELRDSMMSDTGGVLVASRAPFQSVQRSLDSHSGLSRPEWSRAGRMPKCLSTAAHPRSFPVPSALAKKDTTTTTNNIIGATENSGATNITSPVQEFTQGLSSSPTVTKPVP